MYSSKLRPVVYDITKARQSVDENTSCINLRCCLIAWAFLRLTVSVLWTSLLFISTAETIKDYNKNILYTKERPFLIPFELLAIITQLVEFGMIVTFIVAGFKKSAQLYRHYYRYCILTLVLYIAAVSLCLLLGYEYGHYLVEIYLTYHFDELVQLLPIVAGDDTKLFLVTALIDILLEITLIRSVKKLMERYEDNCHSETV